MNNFKFFPAEMGSGWVGGYVAVDEWLTPATVEDRSAICLSFDCQDADEFDGAVDELIKQLESLKVTARAKFSGI